MIVLIAVLVSFTSFSQVKGSISGKICNAANSKIGLAATVSLLKATDSSLVKMAISDNMGNFSFDNVKQGSYMLLATNIGFEKAYSKTITIDEAMLSVKVESLQIAELSKDLLAVTVVSKKPFIERKADRTIINVDASLTNAGNTAMEVLEKSPGVSVDKDGNISLKGKQGVIVTIDGKQTYMGPQDLANYLQSMPASNLELIELMPNPSSKYDASGNSGLINIKTKKNKQIGFNGNVNSTYGRGKYGRTFNTVNLNYKNGKFNVFSTVGANHRKQFQVIDINRKYLNAAGKLDAVFDQQATFIKSRNNVNFKIGADYYANKKTTLGVVVNGTSAPGSQDGGNTSYLKNAFGNTNSIIRSSSFDKDTWKNIGANFNLRHTFDSTAREFTVDVDVIQYKSKQRQNFISESLSSQWVLDSLEELQSELPSNIKVFSAKADYVHPFKSGLKIETGVKASIVNTDNFAGYFNVISGTKVVDNEKTNHFIYNENINAAYINASKEFKKWSLQAGLRFENTNYDGKQFDNPIKKDSTFKRSYSGLFPTMFAGYKPNNKNEFSFSYGRRISRPDYESLNPFVFFIDKYTYEAGNPFLRPMFTNVFELSHTYNKFLTTTLNYTHSKDMFNEYFEQAGYATIVKQNNYGSIDDVSLAVNAELQPTKWWTLLPYAEFNYNAVNSTLYNFTLKTSNVGFNTNVNNQFKFNKGWGAELSAFYRSRMKTGQFDIADMGQVSMGVSKQILKKKGSLKLNFSDMFNSGQQSGTVFIQNTIASFLQVRDSRNVRLTFNYRFGKPFKAKQRKSGGAGEEQNRVKSAG